MNYTRQLRRTTPLSLQGRLMTSLSYEQDWLRLLHHSIWAAAGGKSEAFLIEAVYSAPAAWKPVCLALDPFQVIWPPKQAFPFVLDFWQFFVSQQALHGFQSSDIVRVCRRWRLHAFGVAVFLFFFPFLISQSSSLETMSTDDLLWTSAFILSSASVLAAAEIALLLDAVAFDTAAKVSSQ